MTQTWRIEESRQGLPLHRRRLSVLSKHHEQNESVCQHREEQGRPRWHWLRFRHDDARRHLVQRLFRVSDEVETKTAGISLGSFLLAKSSEWLEVHDVQGFRNEGDSCWRGQGEGL
jgi:hypothetical protein